MLKILLSLRICFSLLTVYSPDALKGSISNLTVFAFGNPSFYDTVGRLVFIDLLSCAVVGSLDNYSIRVMMHT